MEPDRIVFYWTGNLPDNAELSILSALNKSTHSKIEIFLDSDDGFESFVNPRLRALETHSRINFMRFSLMAWAVEVKPRTISLATSLIRRYLAFTLNVIGFPHSTAGKQPNRRMTNLIGFWHPIHGWRPKTDPLYALTFAGPEFRGDVFRVLLSKKYRRESVLYLDLDVYVSKPFTEWPLSQSFSYWGGDTWANTAVLFYHQTRESTSNVLIQKYKDGEWAVPWFMFSEKNCRDSEIEILSTSLFDPGWTATSISRGKSDLFFQTSEYTEQFLEEIYSGFLAVHWHNQWRVSPEVGSPFSILLSYERERATEAKY